MLCTPLSGQVEKGCVCGAGYHRGLDMLVGGDASHAAALGAKSR